MVATASLPVLRTSERSAFKRCPQRWYWEYRMGYRPRAVQADALWLGIGIHEAMAVYYQRGKRRGRHPAATFRDWAGEEIGFARTYLDETFDAPVWEDATELGIAMLEGYVEHWGKDSQWQIIAPEYQFKVRIAREGEPIAIFSSRWDGVLRDLSDGQIYLLETKTAAQIILAYLELDDQGGSYWAVASQVLRAKGILRPGEEIAGIIYNFLRKAMPDERPQDVSGLYHNKPTKEHYVEALQSTGARTVEQASPKSGPIAIDKAKLGDLEVAARFARVEVMGEVSKSQPPPRYIRELVERTPAEQRTQLDRIADEVAVMNAVRDGIIPVTKTPTKDCPRCPFFTPCILHERGKDSYKAILKADFRQIDPYEDMRKSA